ncbi:MAG: mucoidy inhibitor MuiA family protein [Pirellulales bacterium]|nr:mucoidy inhibitor MuiA family protein [Pirellulales bacterium]
MRSTIILGSLALFSLVVASTARSVEALEARGILDTVTVYRGQALVTRLVDVPGPTGLREVVVTDLPEQVVAGSIFAEGAAGIEIRSVRYRQRPMSADVREEVRKLDEQQRAIEDQLTANQQHQNVLNDQKTYLAKLEGFVAPTATVELTQGVLNADTLRALSEYLLTQRRELAEQELQLGKERRQLSQELELLNRQRAVVTGSSARTAREAVVLANLTADAGKLRLKYLVQQATWSPNYAARAAADQKRVTLEYNAQIQQMSGEDWTDVEMILSTATPSLVARAPELEPLTISLVHNAPVQQAAAPAPAQDYAAAKSELSERRRQLEYSRAQSANMPPQEPAAPGQAAGVHAGEAGVDLFSGGGRVNPFDVELNTVAAEDQVLDLLNRRDDGPVASSTRVPRSADISVTYRLPMRTSLPSRADQQLVQIALLPLEGEFYKLASPILTAHVYNEALVTNQGETVLLAGPVSSYLADQFVGQGELPTVAVGETFTLGFGIDSSLRASRELVKQDETIQGGNRVVDFTYRVSIDNFGADVTAVRVFDRVPKAKDGEVKLTLVSTGRELSDDPRYRQAQHGKGLLRWDVSVPAKAAGPQAFAVEYQLRLEYDRQMSIVGSPLAQAP